MEMDETVCNHAVYSKNRERLLNEEIAVVFFSKGAGTRQAVHVGRTLHGGRDADRGLGESEEFSAERREGEATRTRRRGRLSQRRSGRTRPMNRRRIPRRGCSGSPKGAKRSFGYLGHVLMENRSGLLVQTFLTEANGRAEREAAAWDTTKIPET